MSFSLRLVTLIDNFDDMLISENDELNINMEAGESAAEQAQINAIAQGLFLTGFMVDTTAARPLADGDVSVGTLADYGFFHEFGTVSLPAKPWLLPALEQAGEQYGVALQEHFGRRF